MVVLHCTAQYQNRSGAKKFEGFLLPRGGFIEWLWYQERLGSDALWIPVDVAIFIAGDVGTLVRTFGPGGSFELETRVEEWPALKGDAPHGFRRARAGRRSKSKTPKKVENVSTPETPSPTKGKSKGGKGKKSKSTPVKQPVVVLEQLPPTEPTEPDPTPHSGAAEQGESGSEKDEDFQLVGSAKKRRRRSKKTVEGRENLGGPRHGQASKEERFHKPSRPAAERKKLKAEDSGYDSGCELMEAWSGSSSVSKPPTMESIRKIHGTFETRREQYARDEVSPKTLTEHCKIWDANKKRTLAVPSSNGWYPQVDHSYLEYDFAASTDAAIFYAAPTYEVMQATREYATLKDHLKPFSKRKRLGLLRKYLVLSLDWDSTLMKSYITDDMKAGRNARCPVTVVDYASFLRHYEFVDTLNMQAGLLEDSGKDDWVKLSAAPYLLPQLTPWGKDSGWQWLIPHNGPIMPEPIFNVKEIFGSLTRDRSEPAFCCPGEAKVVLGQLAKPRSSRSITIGLMSASS